MLGAVPHDRSSSPRRATPPGAPTAIQRLARRALAAAGWRVDVAWPPSPRCVIVVYPHTSNWDFLVGYLAKLAAGLPAWWIGKHTLFRWPIAGLLRRMGGIPVNRRAPGGLMAELVRELETRDTLWLAIAPEGTRARTDHWKSGFYRLALAGRVPVGLAFIDWRRKVVGLTTYLELTGDEEGDLARIRAAYAGREGKHPENAGEIRFRHGVT
jgi:1-acyl-sn-glycerol-3-phosphate acyltransferase